MPPRWVRVKRQYAAPGVHGSGLAPHLEHRAQKFGGSLDDWRLRVSAADASRDLDVEDDDCFEVAGHECIYRRFGHTVAGVAVLTDQWLWVVDGIGHQLFGTVAAVDYEEYCDVFESVAETFDPGTDRRDRSA
jgi:hypothetical protein